MPVARVRCLFPPKCRCSTPDADHYGLCSNFYMARGHSWSSSRTTGNVRAEVIDHDGSWHGTLSAGFNSNIKLQRTKLAKSALPVPHRSTAVDLRASSSFHPRVFHTHFKFHQIYCSQPGASRGLYMDMLMCCFCSPPSSGAQRQGHFAPLHRACCGLQWR